MPGPVENTLNPFALQRLPSISRVDKRKPDAEEIAKELQKQQLPAVGQPAKVDHGHQDRPQISIDSDKIADTATQRVTASGPVSQPEQLVQNARQTLANHERVDSGLRDALATSQKELDRVRTGISTAPDRLEDHKQAHDMSRQVDALHSACKIAISALEQSSRSIKLHLVEIEQRTKTVRELTDLHDLMKKYESRQELDLQRPKNAEESKDFDRMLEWRQVAINNGVLWDEFAGWKSKDKFKAYTSGIQTALTHLQSQNKAKDLEMQQAISVYQAYALLCSNLILAAAQLHKDIVRNINR
jgi:hypothetical protein